MAQDLEGASSLQPVKLLRFRNISRSFLDEPAVTLLPRSFLLVGGALD